MRAKYEVRSTISNVMKKILVSVVFLLAVHVVFAQEVERHKIAVFTPLYLDSAFDVTGSFKYEKTGAKFTNPGLDFYYGVQTALDSLEKRGAPLEVFVYDI